MPLMHTSISNTTARQIYLAPLLLLALVMLKAAIYGSSGIMDTDFWWHAEYAKFFFKNWRIAETDWMSWTHYGRPYLVTQWLGQILTGAPYLAGGLGASSAATAIVYGLSLLVAWRTARLFVSHPISAFLASFLSTLPLLTIVARPQIYGILSFSILVWAINVWQEKKDRRMLLTIPAIMMLWANLHGSYVIGLVYIVVFAGPLILESLLRNSFSWRELLRTHKAISLACAAAIIATLANPHGIRAWEYIITIAGFETTNSGVIGEWGATNTKSPLGQFFFIVVTAAIVGIATMKGKPAPRQIALFIWALFLGLAAVRQVYFATIAMTPMLATIVRTTRMGHLIELQIPSKVNLSWAIAVVASAAALCWPISSITTTAAKQAEEIAFPVRAMQFLKKTGIDGKLLNEASAGGWTVANTGKSVFIDGRLDLYGDAYFFDWYFARAGLPGWKVFLKKHDPEIFVIQSVTPLRQLLLLDGSYALVYEDDWYSVLVKRQSQYLDVITRHEREPAPFHPFDVDGHLRPGWKGW